MYDLKLNLRQPDQQVFRCAVDRALHIVWACYCTNIKRSMLVEQEIIEAVKTHVQIVAYHIRIPSYC